MKKILPLLIIGILSIGTVRAQSLELSPTVISSAGNYSEAGGISLSWTLGEIAVTTMEAGSIMLTQGFQQGYLDNTGLVPEPISWNVALYPNPVRNALRIQFDVPEPGDFLVEIQDVNGKVISQEQYKQVFPGDVIPVDMSRYEYGVYFFRISTFDREQTRVVSVTRL